MQPLTNSSLLVTWRLPWICAFIMGMSSWNYLFLGGLRFKHKPQTGNRCPVVSSISEFWVATGRLSHWCILDLWNLGAENQGHNCQQINISCVLLWTECVHHAVLDSHYGRVQTQAILRNHATLCIHELHENCANRNWIILRSLSHATKYWV